jgi:hypothetical protein
MFSKLLYPLHRFVSVVWKEMWTNRKKKQNGTEVGLRKRYKQNLKHLCRLLFFFEKKNQMPSKKPAVTATAPGEEPKKKKAAPKKKEPGTGSADVDVPAKKTRTGRIITKAPSVEISPMLNTNVVLNLKCSMADLHQYNETLNRMIMNNFHYNSAAPPEVTSYEEQGQPFSSFESPVQPQSQALPPPPPSTSAPASSPAVIQCGCCRSAAPEDNTVNNKELLTKLKHLKVQLYTNSLQQEKKSACFWCTYDFDNVACLIPKHEMDGNISGYGSFCRPECAVAYLMKEDIDDSAKFERYNLLNQTYSKVYGCKKNIKPAPDPHYLLDKFYGNMTIQEYRKLLKTEHLLLVVDKPFTRTLPELHEEIDDNFTKIYGIKNSNNNVSGVYKVKRQSEQTNGPTKASIVRSVFGLPTK